MQRTRRSVRARLAFLVVAVGGAVGVVALTPSPASAQAIRAAALPPQLKGTDTSPELRNKFEDAVVRGLATLNGPAGPNGELGEVMTAAATRARLGDELSACAGTPACLPRAVASLGVNRLFATDLSINGKTYTMSLKLYDRQGHELTHADDTCDICTVHEAEEAVTKAAARLAAVARTLPIDASAPPPLVGSTPAHPAETSSVPPSPMQPPPLTAGPPVVVRHERRHVPWRGLAFGSLALGVVGIGAGVPLLVIDGRPTCNLPDPSHSCPHVYNTAGGGATLVALGAIGLIGSVPLFYFDWRSTHRPVTALSLRGGPLAGGAGMQLSGHF
jgi:hypothetical protein